MDPKKFSEEYLSVVKSTLRARMRPDRTLDFTWNGQAFLEMTTHLDQLFAQHGEAAVAAVGVDGVDTQAVLYGPAGKSFEELTGMSTIYSDRVVHLDLLMRFADDPWSVHRETIGHYVRGLLEIEPYVTAGEVVIVPSPYHWGPVDDREIAVRTEEDLAAVECEVTKDDISRSHLVMRALHSAVRLRATPLSFWPKGRDHLVAHQALMAGAQPGLRNPTGVQLLEVLQDVDAQTSFFSIKGMSLQQQAVLRHTAASFRASLARLVKEVRLRRGKADAVAAVEQLVEDIRRDCAEMARAERAARMKHGSEGLALLAGAITVVAPNPVTPAIALGAGVSSFVLGRAPRFDGTVSMFLNDRLAERHARAVRDEVFHLVEVGDLDEVAAAQRLGLSPMEFERGFLLYLLGDAGQAR